MCLYPILVNNPKYKMNKKNGGIPPVMKDQRVRYVPVGCGICSECRKKRAGQWIARLDYERLKEDGVNMRWVTLTFDEERLREYIELATMEIEKKREINKGYDVRNVACKIAVRKFLERIRKKTGSSVKHWLVTELGGSHSKRIHMHGFIWTTEELIKEKWMNGYVYVDKSPAGAKSITYAVKYVSKIHKDEKLYQSKIMTSAGIGKGWDNSNGAKEARYKPNGATIESYHDKEGIKRGIPIYWRNKIYSDDEREKLWIEKLDRGERWIGGKLIRRRNYSSYEDYEDECIKMLREAQRDSRGMGYAGSSRSGEKKYREDLRRLRGESYVENKKVIIESRISDWRSRSNDNDIWEGIEEFERSRGYESEAMRWMKINSRDIREREKEWMEEKGK